MQRRRKKVVHTGMDFTKTDIRPVPLKSAVWKDADRIRAYTAASRSREEYPQTITGSRLGDESRRENRKRSWNDRKRNLKAEEAAKAGEVAEDATEARGKGKVKIESSSNFKGQIYKSTRNAEIDFVNGKGKSTLTKHTGKHGYASTEEYLKDARNFLEKQPTSTTKSFVSSEGTYFRYDKATNEFGIINQYGGISTYYKPEEGMTYWLEQIEKYAPKWIY